MIFIYRNIAFNNRGWNIVLKKHFHVFILVTFFFADLKSFSQQYFVKTYTIEDGLPTRFINDACQDNDGIMWFATNYGISKYDGFSFSNYNTSTGLPDQVYKKIKIDETGLLWAMPEKKSDSIVFFKDNNWVKIPPPDKDDKNLYMNSFGVIYKNTEPVICMGSYDGYYIYQNKKWKHFKISDKEELNYIYTVVEYKQKFYLSTKKGICTIDNTENGKTDWSLNALIKPFGLETIAISFENKYTEKEKIWVLNENWLGCIENNKFNIVSNKFKLPHPLIFYYAFVESDKNGNIFFGNIWAKYYLSKSSDIPVPLMVKNGFSSVGATSVFIDREQNIWFTDTRGICKLNNLKIVNYFERNGLLENEVTAIAEMKDGRIILGHNKGLSILKNNTFKTIEFPDSESRNKRVPEIIRDNNGNIWFVSLGLGLGQLTADDNIRWYNLYQNKNTNAVLQDKSGRIWMSADKKLYYIQNNQLIEYEHNDRIQNHLRRIFSADTAGIFIAGTYGLWYFNKNIAKKIPSPANKKADDVYSYYKDKNGSEFVGSLHGLYKIVNGKIIKYKKGGIEIDSPVFFIFQDTDENYWIGSDNGVYKWDGKDKIEVFNTYNGLAGWETNRAAGMVDSKGQIWIGTDRGLTCFQPGYNNLIVPTPSVKLLYAESSQGVKFSLSQESKFNFTDNTLNFTFRGISYFNEDLIEYKYKLEGFDNNWQIINQSSLDRVKYIGLRPGKYTFCVMAKNFSGEWSKVVRSELIIITPPFYYTWWFILLALISVSGIIYGLIRFNFQQLHNFKLETEIVERKRIEQALTESKQRYRDLVELLPETVYETDCQGRLVYLNDTGFRQFGYPHTELRNDFYIYQLITPDCADEMSKHINIVHNLKQPDKTTMTGMKKDGTSFPISIHTVPIIGNRDCLGARGIIIDLTEQKRFEDQLQKNAEDLLALNNSKDKFFSIIAHDLRSPFNTFLGFTEMLYEEIDTLPKEELLTIITSMRLSAINLYQLLENLLEWSLLHREITKFEPSGIRLYPIVQNCSDLIKDNANRKNVKIKINIPESIEVKADTHMLQTIIRNLLSNALKFTPRGGNIQISASEGQEHSFIIAVKDTGIGIKAEKISKIFRLDSNNNAKGTEGELSTGLGLVLCKEFVEKHGGKIWVESEEGKGSTFFFTLESVKS